MGGHHDLFGLHYGKEKGYVAVVGNGNYKHLFGGEEWAISEREPLGSGPTVLVTLDLRDPVFCQYKDLKIENIPLCSYLNCVWFGRQVYQINSSGKRAIEFMPRESRQFELLDSNDLFKIPFLPKKLLLRPLEKDEYPLDEELYWNCCDEFLGGRSVIRVIGPPIWLQEIAQEKCDCGKEMEYFASIGYEVENEFRQLIDREPFFPGEMAHYYFICRDCLKMSVIQQST
jgi:hypothetical protein